jgi:integrase/recombinase XerC
MSLTINQAFSAYLESVGSARNYNTVRAYRNGIILFEDVIKENGINPENSLCSDLTETAIGWLANRLKNYAPNTERLYLTAVMGFYEYLAAEELASINQARLRLLIKQRTRRTGQRLPQFPRDNMETVIEYALVLSTLPANNYSDLLRNLRDRAFLLTLADTGLRVHEACNLKRGDLDWNEGKAMIIGKGDRQAIIRFSRRSLRALHEYLAARSKLDGNSSRPLVSLPLFARHDRGAGLKIKPITTTTGRNIVTQRVVEVLGDNCKGIITPHSFRHYFVTTVLRGSGGNLKLAQELARHRNISVTQRYAHLSDTELDRGYWEIFEQDNSQITKDSN